MSEREYLAYKDRYSVDISGKSSIVSFKSRFVISIINCYICGFAVVFHYAVDSPNEINGRKSEKLFRSFDCTSVTPVTTRFPTEFASRVIPHDAPCLLAIVRMKLSLSSRSSKPSVVFVCWVKRKSSWVFWSFSVELETQFISQQPL